MNDECNSTESMESGSESSSENMELISDVEDEDENFDELVKCLFCEQHLTGMDEAFEHLRIKHNVDLNELNRNFKMDQHSFIKLINCIRREGIKAEQVATAKSTFWADEKYLKPIEYEPWLTFDYEALNSTNADVNDVETLKKRIAYYETLLERAKEDKGKMQATLQRLLDLDSDAVKPTTKNVNCVAAHHTLTDDEQYFNGYAHFSIHHEMLSDKVRTNSYRNALMKNSEFVNGKEVLDIGCGTGVLSIFASQAGARMVVGIDNSDIIYHAMEIVKTNKLNNITLIKDRLEDTKLSHEKYDIIISEWMGYLLLFEGMLDSVIYARERHLKPNGVLLPNRCNLNLLGYGDEKLFEKHVTFWDDVYGLNMSCMRKQVLREPLIDIVDEEHILTEPEVIADYNLATVDLNYSDFTHTFNLNCNKNGKLCAFVGYFDTFFELPHPISFSTGPKATPTHWKQVVFFLEEAIDVKVNDKITGSFNSKRSPNNARSLDITIKFNGKKCKYYLH